MSLHVTLAYGLCIGLWACVGLAITLALFA
jgi:hypothetical protein